MSLKLFTLGNVRFEQNGKPIGGFPSRAADAVLIYLACHNHPVPRDTLATLLWTGRTQKNARNNLRTILSTLKQRLGDYLIITRHDVAFNHHADYWLDCVAFENLLAQFEADGDITLLQNAVNLYRGDFLVGFQLRDGRGFEEWALPVQERLHHAVTFALHHLIRFRLKYGDYMSALTQLEHLLTIDPFDEAGQRWRMQALLRLGRRNAAIKSYREYRQSLFEVMGVSPDVATQAFYTRIKNAKIPPAHRLPVLPTTFIGRQLELTTIARYFADPACRLISILGPGGIGKTSIAIQAAWHLLEKRPGQFLDGIFFVPLAALEENMRLLYLVAHTLNAIVPDRENSEAQLLEFLCDKELLLILDNFEHLISPESIQWLSNLLASAPRVNILLTSRARLNLPEEHTIDLRGLSYPVGTSRNAEDFSAVKLFLQHANRVRYMFQPNADEMAAIVQFCQTVDGMPLAIELAAAETRYFSCRYIVTEIKKRLDFQCSSDGNRPPRQTSLRATIEYSWTLLAEREHIINVARRLAVFHGAFTLAAAMAITNATPHQLISLVDRSFLQRNAHDFFEIHPLIHLFLTEKLAEHPAEEDEARTRHAIWYATLVKSASGHESENMERHYFEMTRTVDTHFDNIIAATLHLAHRHLFSERSLTTLIEALIFYFLHTHRYQEWKIVFQQIINALQKNPDGSYEERWLTLVLSSRIAQANISLHAYRQAEKKLQSIMADVYALKNNILISACLEMMSMLAARAGNFQTARATARKALAAVASSPNHYRWSVYRVLGDIALAAGDLTQATAAHRESFALAAAVDSAAEALPIYKLAMGKIAHRQGHLKKAASLFSEALAAAHVIGKQEEIIACMTELGRVFTAMGDTETAHRWLAEGLLLNEILDDRYWAASLMLVQGQLAETEGDFAAAQLFYRQSIAFFAKVGDRINLPYAQIYLARVLLHGGETVTAQNLARTAAIEFERQRQPTGIALVQQLNNSANLMG